MGSLPKRLVTELKMCLLLAYFSPSEGPTLSSAEESWAQRAFPGGWFLFFFLLTAEMCQSVFHSNLDIGFPLVSFLPFSVGTHHFG